MTPALLSKKRESHLCSMSNQCHAKPGNAHTTARIRYWLRTTSWGLRACQPTAINVLMCTDDMPEQHMPTLHGATSSSAFMLQQSTATAALLHSKLLPTSDSDCMSRQTVMPPPVSS
jgi:hypothetical protein